MRAWMLATLWALLLLTACGGGGGQPTASSTVAASPTSAPSASVIASPTSAPTATATALAAASPTVTRVASPPTTPPSSPPAAPSAATLSCGQELTASVTLANDLQCDPVGLVITGDNVILDLGGRTINGPGPGRRTWPLPQFDVVGVRVLGKNATVRNGAVTGFGLSVLAQETTGATFTGVRAEGSYFGIYLYKGGQHRIDNNIVRGNVYGLHLQESSGNQLLGNQLLEQIKLSPGGYGLYLYGSQDNRIEFNTVRDNINWGLWFSQSSGNTIVRNNILGNRPEVSDDSGGNTFYDDATREGNFWGDYQGADANGDGIGDTPYTIGGPGRTFDLYPFVALDGWRGRAAQTAALAAAPPATPAPSRAYIALADGSVAVLEPPRDTPLAIWPAGVSVASMATSFDGARLYVIVGQGADARVRALDTATGAVAQEWSVPGARVVAAMYDGARLIVAGSEGLLEIVLATNEQRAQPNGEDAVSITPSWKHNVALVSGAGGTLSLVYLPNQHTPYQMPLPGAPTQVVDNRAGTRLFALLTGQTDVYVIDSEEFAVTDRIPLGDIDPTQARLAPSPDGTTLYVLDRASSRVVAIDLGTKQAVRELQISGQAVDLAVSADGASVTIVAASAAGRAIITNRDLEPLASVDLAAEPLSVMSPR